MRFSSYSPAFYVQNKMRLKDVKRRVQTQRDRPNHMSSRYSKKVNDLLNTGDQILINTGDQMKEMQREGQ